jgi:excisionase family DNA binding protein
MPSMYVSEKEAAAYLGVSLSTIRRWRRKGIGPRFFRLERILRYSLEALERFTAEHTKSAA